MESVSRQKHIGGHSLCKARDKPKCDALVPVDTTCCFEVLVCMCTARIRVSDKPRTVARPRNGSEAAQRSLDASK